MYQWQNVWVLITQLKEYVVNVVFFLFRGRNHAVQPLYLMLCSYDIMSCVGYPEAKGPLVGTHSFESNIMSDPHSFVGWIRYVLCSRMHSRFFYLLHKSYHNWTFSKLKIWIYVNTSNLAVLTMNKCHASIYIVGICPFQIYIHPCFHLNLSVDQCGDVFICRINWVELHWTLQHSTRRFFYIVTCKTFTYPWQLIFTADFSMIRWTLRLNIQLLPGFLVSFVILLSCLEFTHCNEECTN